MEHNYQTAILLIHCADQKGIIASITDFLSSNKGNIIELDEHVDRHEKVFFMRVEWEMDGFLIAPDDINKQFEQAIGERYQMVWRLYFTGRKRKMAVFVSKYDHCLYDIMGRYQSGEWNVEIPLIVSNHGELNHIAERFDIPFHHIKITKENKKEQEQKQITLLREHGIDFVVLARYMQILSEDFIREFTNKIINIHHSFLPAFPGAKPYHSAYERGVKIIGASSHYVTSDLDEGPLIEQDVVRVSHKDSIQSLMRKGRDLEKIVLSRAIWHHLEHKVMVFKNRTVIFD
jgi:formyltetrahydrofolate deformylase